jgi:hypothetical protein
MSLRDGLVNMENLEIGDVISEYRVGNIIYQKTYIGGNSWVIIPLFLEIEQWKKIKS